MFIEAFAEETSYHYTNEEGARGILDDEKIQGSGGVGEGDASFGPGSYATGGWKRTWGSYDQAEILQNNYGPEAPAEKGSCADCVIETKTPRRGPDAAKHHVDPGAPQRDIRTVSKGDYPLSGKERHGKFDDMKQNAVKTVKNHN